MAKGTWMNTYTGEVYDNTNQLGAALRSFKDYIRTANENGDNIKYLALVLAPIVIDFHRKKMRKIQV